MSEMTHVPDDVFAEPASESRLPALLNVLTILTLIGSSIGAISSVYSYFTTCSTLEKMQSKEMPELGGMLGKMLEGAMELMEKQCENRLVILVASLASIALCFAGALMMRKLQKQGFIVYFFGEWIGPISMGVILGSSSFGGPMMLLGWIVPVVMVILYATQRKYLTR